MMYLYLYICINFSYMWECPIKCSVGRKCHIDSVISTRADWLDARLIAPLLENITTPCKIAFLILHTHTHTHTDTHTHTHEAILHTHTHTHTLGPKTYYSFTIMYI